MQRLKYTKEGNILISQTILLDGLLTQFLVSPASNESEGLNIYLVRAGEEPEFLANRKSRHTAFRFVKKYLLNSGFTLVKETRKKRKEQSNV